MGLSSHASVLRSGSAETDMSAKRGGVLTKTAIEYATAYQMSAEETADVLADAYLKGLLAAHHDARAESAAAWTPADFVSCTEVRQTAMKHMQWAWRGCDLPNKQDVRHTREDDLLLGFVQSIRSVSSS